MIQGNRIICVVPARGGSKGLPGKNIASLCGKPLITWTLEAALQSKYVDEIYVSTDSEKIASVARQSGLDITELRPSELASDVASSIDVVLHAIDRAEKLNQQKYQFICLLEPTSPLRDSKDIDDAFEQLLHQDNAEAIVGVCASEAGHPSFLATRENGLLVPYQKTVESNHIRRQDLSEIFYFEGSVYISKTNALRVKKSFYHETTAGYEVPRWKALEIDEKCDLIMAEALLKAKLEGDLE